MDLTRAKTTAKKWLSRVVLGLAVLTVAGAAIYTIFTLVFVYSTGERVGFVQKLSKRGWLCKTNEGELAMVNMAGQQAQMFDFTVPDDAVEQAQMFDFTVPDDAVAKQIEDLAGHRIVLNYEQHRGIPTSCFGETEYFVVGVKKAD